MLIRCEVTGDFIRVDSVPSKLRTIPFLSPPKSRMKVAIGVISSWMSGILIRNCNEEEEVIEFDDEPRISKIIMYTESF